ncbi:MAG: hypothetical protein LBR07_07830 [Puniceicoccales bacterium]|jgi:hypothetical protein|nr:hypothetical protein [Puniceicoccales bacterium]
MQPRPKTLAQIAERSDTLREFGYHTRDWEHELARLRTHAEVLASIETEPVLLAPHFAQGEVADAWLAATAELLCARLDATAPPWVYGKNRFLPENKPWFSIENETTNLRLLTLRDTPSAFKSRNLFSGAVCLPLYRLKHGVA